MKTAVVLGASTGVGAAIAKELSKTHYIAGFHRGRHLAEAREVQRAIAADGGEYSFYESDAGSELADVDASAGMLRHDSEVSVFVHSLSGASLGTSLDLTSQKVERTMNVMAHSFLYWVQALVKRELLADGAHVIALSNPCSDFYLRNTGVIGAAKAALEAYVRILAVELCGTAFVNCIRFSTVVTPALQKVLSPESISGLTALHTQIVPAQRMQTADDVAGFVGRLVQDKWMNGAVIDYTGGATLTLMDRAFYGDR